MRRHFSMHPAMYCSCIWEMRVNSASLKYPSKKVCEGSRPAHRHTEERPAAKLSDRGFDPMGLSGHHDFRGALDGGMDGAQTT